MFENKAYLKIISLLAAIVLWMYVMGEVDPETSAKIYDIPVNLTGTDTLAEYGMAVALDEEYTISANISGKRSDVNQIKKNGLTAAVDVSDCEKGINIEKITVNLPSGISLENASEATMTITVEELVYEEKPVEIKFAEEDLSASGETVQKQTPWILDYTPEKITVSGAKSSVDKVKKLIGYVNAEDAVISEDRWVNVTLTPVNKHGREILNVELHSESAEADIRILTLKNVDLNLNFEDEDIDIEEFDIPEVIRIAGPKGVIKDLKTVEGIVSVDGDTVYIDTDLPENVFIISGEENGKIVWN